MFIICVIIRGEYRKRSYMQFDILSLLNGVRKLAINRIEIVNGNRCDSITKRRSGGLFLCENE